MPLSRAEDRAATMAHDREFFTALGSLFYHYTNLEHQLTCLVRNMLTRNRDGLDYHIAVATMSGMRMQTVKDTINRLLRVTGADKPTLAFVSGVFSQLGEIQFLRDRLAHHYTCSANDLLDHIWHNEDFASIREVSKSKRITFHTSSLAAAAQDLTVILTRMDTLMAQHTGAEGSLDMSPIAWRYKLSMLIRTGPKLQRSHQSQKPLPQSSEA